MKIIRYIYKNSINIGLIINKNSVINIRDLKIKIDNMIDFIDFLNNKNFQPQKKYNEKKLLKLKQVKLLSPIGKPNSLRDAYAFKKHVEAGRKGRNLPMIKEFDSFPVYYYSNHSAINGPGNIFFHQSHFKLTLQSEYVFFEIKYCAFETFLSKDKVLLTIIIKKLITNPKIVDVLKG